MSTDLNASSVRPFDVAKDLPALPAAVGPLGDLHSNVVPFTTTLALPTSGAVAHVDLFAATSIKRRAAPHFSAAIKGDVTVDLVANIGNSATVIMALGVACVLPTGGPVPDSRDRILLSNGGRVFLGPMGTSGAVTLPFPPGVCRDVNIKQPLGTSPVVYACVSFTGLSDVALVISGSLEVSGVRLTSLWA